MATWARPTSRRFDLHIGEIHWGTGVVIARQTTTLFWQFFLSQEPKVYQHSHFYSQTYNRSIALVFGLHHFDYRKGSLYRARKKY